MLTPGSNGDNNNHQDAAQAVDTEKKMNKKSVAVALFSLQASVAMAVCPYTLDATTDQILKYGAKPFPSISGQSVAFNVQDNSLSPYGLNYGAGSSAGAKAYLDAQKSGVAGGDVKLPATGTVAVEFRVDSYAATQPSSNPAGAGIGYGISSGNTGTRSTGPMLDVQLRIVDERSSSGVPRVQVEAKARSGTGAPVVNASAQTALTLPLPTGFRLGLYVNRGTGAAGYTVNGVDMGVLRDSAGNPLRVPSTLTAVSIGVGGGHLGIQPGDVLIGTTIGGTLVTDATQMTQPYPAGTRDLCAVPVAG